MPLGKMFCGGGWAGGVCGWCGMGWRGGWGVADCLQAAVHQGARGSSWAVGGVGVDRGLLGRGDQDRYTM